MADVIVFIAHRMQASMGAYEGKMHCLRTSFLKMKNGSHSQGPVVKSEIISFGVIKLPDRYSVVLLQCFLALIQ
jgi:hypothetical protein